MEDQSIRDNQHYEVVNPKNGRTEVWTGERIKAYQVNYKVDISFPKKKVTPKRSTGKTKKT